MQSSGARTCRSDSWKIRSSREACLDFPTSLQPGSPQRAVREGRCLTKLSASPKSLGPQASSGPEAVVQMGEAHTQSLVKIQNGTQPPPNPVLVKVTCSLSASVPRHILSL